MKIYKIFIGHDDQYYGTFKAQDKKHLEELLKKIYKAEVHKEYKGAFFETKATIQVISPYIELSAYEFKF